VVVSLVAAGPAAAAKGGNNDNAHACQQGGATGLFETETGLPFKNPGDCASHGAKGRPFTALSVVMNQYTCFSNETCFGTVNASGLDPDSSVAVVLRFDDGSSGQQNPQTDGNGNLSYQVDVQCDDSPGAVNVRTVQAAGTTNGGQTGVETPEVGTPCG
jgi:hypothetical protein